MLRTVSLPISSSLMMERRAARRRKILKFAGLMLLSANRFMFNKIAKKHDVWIKPWLAARDIRGCYNQIISELRLQDEENYRRYLRMNVDTFEYLLRELRPLIIRRNVVRPAIPPEQRLAITLRYYATGESYYSLQFQFRVSVRSIGRIVRRVSQAIVTKFRDVFMNRPNSVEKWRAISDVYRDRWNFPNCIGAIDGKHIRIKRPDNAVSGYHNYKGYHSIVLLALVDADYKFIDTDIGTSGREGDSTIFRYSEMYKRMQNKTLNLPEDCILPNDDPTDAGKMPFLIVGDDAFPLKRNLLKPYAQKDLTDGKRIFNYRLSRARRTSENAFGILAQVFRVFYGEISCDVDTAKIVTEACCILHNILRGMSRDSYTPTHFVDTVDVDGEIIEGSWRLGGDPLDGLKKYPGQKSSYDAEGVRDYFREYFQLQGSVPWQYRHIYH